MASVPGALLYLRVVSLRNSLRARLARLKQPKYLIGALVGGAYLFFVFGGFSPRRRGGGDSGAVPALGGTITDEVLVSAGSLIALGLTVAAVVAWLVPRGRAALAFSEPEIAFLFSAPVSRRALIHYRLISSQFAILLTVMIFTVLSRHWSFVPGGAGIRFAGFWLLFATIGLHLIGSSFVITKWLDRGVTPLRRQLAVLGVVALAASALTIWIRSTMQVPADVDLASLGGLVEGVMPLLRTPPLAYVLQPAAWVAGPLLARDVQAFLAALTPALLVYVAHYWWVLRMNVAFEEQSIEKAAKRAAQIAAVRAGGSFAMRRKPRRARAEPFRLAPQGRPEVGLLWKNLLSTPDFLRPRTALIVAAIICAAGVWLMNHPELLRLRVLIGMSAAGIAAYVLFFGPLVARQDLRRDLLNADLLKAYPLAPWQVVLGEMLAPIAILTVLLWLLVLTVAFTFQPDALGLSLRVAGAFALALNAPFVCALQVFVANATTLVFPAWFAMAGQKAAPGIDSFGQRIVALWGQIFLVLLALVPAAILAFLLFLLANWLFGVAAAVACAAIGVAAVLAAELALGVWWLGNRFERFDLSAELRT